MPAEWMRLPDDLRTSAPSVAELGRYRTTLDLAAPPSGAVPLVISADSRYRLFVNGEMAAVGPAKPSDDTWFADEVDIAPMLVVGHNVIGVEVLGYGGDAEGNVSVRRSSVSGLSIMGMVGGVDLGSVDVWRCAAAAGRRFFQGINTVFLGVQEAVDASLEPHGWLDHDFEDAWGTPLSFTRPTEDPAWMPERRPIPPMAMEPIELIGISRSRGTDPGWANLLTGGAVTIAANQMVDVDFDAGELLTAFIDVAMTGGTGAAISVTAAECYEGTPIDLPWLRRKGDRTDATHGELYGDPDTYRPAGRGDRRRPERYSPFWFRTFRYLRISVRTADAPITISAVRLTRTHYPLDVTGWFRSSSDVDTRLWETSERTLLNCMHETFEDCPFYEQMQYAMDTRSQALYSLHLSSDDRLVRRAIADFASSGDPFGLTASRAPSIRPQIIPGFSLYWVLMVGEHLTHVGDRAFTRRYLSRVDSVLAVFDGALADDGFVISPPEAEARADRPEMWNFVDWTDAWRLTRGVPDLGVRRANTILTFEYVAALRSAARTADECGEAGKGLEYRARAAGVLRRLESSTVRDPETGYFRDSDGGTPASQHAQVWAVLAGAVAGEDATNLLSRAVRDPTLAPCSYAMSHSLFDALRLAGVHDLVDWQPWIDMLDLGLTTWAEDTVSNRSDCHAWGSVPLHHFPRWVLGVSPTAPGFASALIAPAPSTLEHAEGAVPTPHGPIRVRWERRSAESVAVVVHAPVSITLEVGAPASSVRHTRCGDQQTLRFDHDNGSVRSTHDEQRKVPCP